MDAFDLLRRAPYFASVSSAKLAALAKVCEVRCYVAGDPVVRAGGAQTHVMFLAAGRVAFFRRNPKRQITFLLGRVLAPSVFGDMEHAAGVPWAITGRAELACTCVLIPNHAFDAFITGEADLLLHLYRDASVRHLLAHQSGQALALYDVETRLLRLLLDRATAEDAPADTACIAPAPSQVEMAALLGVHRRTVARTLTPLFERGSLTRSADGTGLVLHGVRALRAALPGDLLGVSSQGYARPRPLREAPST